MARAAKLEIEKVLVVSTSHLGAALATGYQPPIDRIASMKGEWGWLVWTGCELGSLNLCLRGTAEEPAALAVLLDLLHFAKQKGCEYVRFDSDGPQLKKFPLYDW